MPGQTPFVDHAAPILRGDPQLDDEARASLWDVFHNSKDSNELAKHLAPISAPDDTKQSLFTAKQQSDPVASPVDKVSSVLLKMKALDPQALEVAETHPNVFKTLAAAASAPEKGAEGATGANTAGKGKRASESKGKTAKTTTLAPDVPATPSQHALIKASDGGLHHIPTANVTRARQIDPDLQVLHVEP